MNKLKSMAVNALLRSRKGNETFAQINILIHFGHFGEAACVARKVLDENSAVGKKFPKITSYERKLLVGSHLSCKEKAALAGQKIPTYPPRST